MSERNTIDAAPETPDQDAIIVYGTPTCPGVPPVMGALRTTKAPYHYIDITRDDDANALVRSINDGNASVPTLVFPDGSTLTEPSGAALTAKLQAMGYRVPLLARLSANAFPLIMGAVILFALLRFFEVI